MTYYYAGLQTGELPDQNLVGAAHDLGAKTFSINVFDFLKGTNPALTTDLLEFQVEYKEEYKMNNKLT